MRSFSCWNLLLSRCRRRILIVVVVVVKCQVQQSKMSVVVRSLFVSTFKVRPNFKLICRFLNFKKLHQPPLVSKRSDHRHERRCRSNTTKPSRRAISSSFFFSLQQNKKLIHIIIMAKSIRSKSRRKSRSEFRKTIGTVRFGPKRERECVCFPHRHRRSG